LRSTAAKLQADLAHADTAILTVTDGLIARDSTRVNSGQTAFAEAILAADSDAGAGGA
jgi:hypothetical protein